MKKGVSFILLSGLFFALANMFAKLCKLPEVEKNFLMTVIALFFAIGLFSATKKKIVINDKKTLIWLIIRSLLGLAGSIMYLYAITNLSLANATLLNKTSPFFVIIFSTLFLSEKLDKRLIIAVILAAFGTIFIIKPSTSYTIGAAVIGLLSGTFSGAAYVSIRYLKDYTNPETIALSFCVISIIASIPLMAITKFVMPSLTDILLILGMGVTVALAQYALSIAYSVAKASKISIYTYAEVVFASIIGLIIWKEYIDIATIIGGLLIIIGGAINYKNEDETQSDSGEVAVNTNN